MEFSTPSDTIVLMACTARVMDSSTTARSPGPGTPITCSICLSGEAGLPTPIRTRLYLSVPMAAVIDLRPLCPPALPCFTYTNGADGQVYVVRNHDQPFRIGPGTECKQILRRFPTQVYVRTRQGQDGGVATDVYLACAGKSRLFSSTAPVSSASR